MRRLFGSLRNERGVAGLTVGGVVWALSVVALGFAMRADLAADGQGRVHDFGGAGLLIRHLHGSAVLWGLGFAALQLLALRLRSFCGPATGSGRRYASWWAGFVVLGDFLGWRRY